MLHKHEVKKENLLDTETRDESLLAYIQARYPETLSEGRLNLEALLRLLGIESSERGYELNFTGKPLATALYGCKSTKEFKLEKSFNPSNTPADSKTPTIASTAEQSPTKSLRGSETTEAIHKIESKDSKPLDSSNRDSTLTHADSKTTQPTPTPADSKTPAIASTAEQSPTKSLRGSETTEAIHKIESKVDCHALQSKARNDREADSRAESHNDKGANASLRGSEATEAIHKIESKLDCHNSANAESHNESDSKTQADSTPHIIIRGDNLDALKLLKSAYTEKIKMIYIDPPYNTKNDNFIYNDSKREDFTQILREVGLLYTNNKGEEVASESLNFFRNITGSKSHSGWLTFMLPRLKLARDLLKDDGVIFISIDDNEQANLKLLCDEIFGEENFIETFLWNKTQTPPSASNKTRKTHEFILCYQKSRDNQKMIARFSEGGDAPLWNETNSERILTFPQNYVFSNLSDGIYKKGIRDKIELLDDVEVVNGKIINSFRLKGHFRWKQESLDEEISNNVYLIVKSNKFSIRYCREGERIVMPTNEISKKDEVGTNETASSELESLMGKKIFSFNKPISLIRYLIKISTTSPANVVGGGGATHRIA